MHSILIVDDEPTIRQSLTGVLEDEGFKTSMAESGEAGLEILGKHVFDVVLLDVWLPGIDGLETLEKIREKENAPEVIMISGHGNIETAVRATKLGAYDFLEKPLSIDKTLILIKNAIDAKRLREENRELKKQLIPKSVIVGDSIPMKALRQQIQIMAPTNGRVLIYGESGTGKELVAHAIHAQGLRKDEMFVEVNCAAIPEDLIESELFGHRTGSFPGATGDKEGTFQKAHGGTLFLDEIGDLPPEMQPKLLRVLQDGNFEPVGSDRTRHAKVRIIAATNHDLNSLVREGRFRADLYYRLSVFPLEVPPLRERRDDITVLATHFLETACKRFNRTGLRLSATQFLELRNYDWPGNVRELQNVIERAVIASRLGSLKLELPGIAQSGTAPSGSPASASISASQQTAEVIPDKEMNLRVRENMIAALQRSSGRIYGPGGAAELLGLRPSTLNTRIKKLGLK